DMWGPHLQLPCSRSGPERVTADRLHLLWHDTWSYLQCDQGGLVVRAALSGPRFRILEDRAIAPVHPRVRTLKAA
ncbi:hypothetical protein PIB30_101387, partial [Stylosanthes scabra]|nr:hypothetical protein [Stylosanthes scabra]